MRGIHDGAFAMRRRIATDEESGLRQMPGSEDSAHQKRLLIGLGAGGSGNGARRDQLGGSVEESRRLEAGT